jgi:hypothetical protein
MGVPVKVPEADWTVELWQINEGQRELQHEQQQQQHQEAVILCHHHFPPYPEAAVAVFYMLI